MPPPSDDARRRREFADAVQRTRDARDVVLDLIARDHAYRRAGRFALTFALLGAPLLLLATVLAFVASWTAAPASAITTGFVVGGLLQLAAGVTLLSRGLTFEHQDGPPSARLRRARVALDDALADLTALDPPDGVVVPPGLLV